MVGEVVLTVTDAQGVTRVQVKSLSPEQEKASLKLYNRIKPLIESLDVHATAGKARAVDRR